MPDTELNRDDVVVTEPRRFRIPFLLHLQVMAVRIGGQDYEVDSVKVGPFKARTEVRAAAPRLLVRQKSLDTEQAIAALLDVLNTHAREQS